MKLPRLSSRELCSFLEKEGFSCIRQKGSHKFYKHPDGRRTTVPMHTNKDIKRGLLKGIIKQIEMTREEFFEKLKK